MNYTEVSKALNGKKVLITGGAGFIGSTLAETLLKIGASVVVLDSLITGFQSNIDRLISYKQFEFIQADICNPIDYTHILKDIDCVSHQAALGSVPRSIEFPLNTHHANATGFLCMIHAVKEAGIKRFVYASSSSVYGDSEKSPKVEGEEGNALSPYAVTKTLNEQYARVYNQLHGLETIGLRYFNVFGKYQNPNGAYAAAIPKFLDKMIHGGEIVVNGDGNQTRDFTYVQNAVWANLLALTTQNYSAFGESFNVACGASYSINEVINVLENGLRKIGQTPKHTIKYGPNREGDIPKSLADITKISNLLEYSPKYSFQEGIDEYLQLI